MSKNNLLTKPSSLGISLFWLTISCPVLHLYLGYTCKKYWLKSLWRFAKLLDFFEIHYFRCISKINDTLHLLILYDDTEYVLPFAIFRWAPINLQARRAWLLMAHDVTFMMPKWQWTTQWISQQLAYRWAPTKELVRWEWSVIHVFYLFTYQQDSPADGWIEKGKGARALMLDRKRGINTLRTLRWSVIWIYCHVRIHLIH